MNNPLNYIDPSGHQICDSDGYCGDDPAHEENTSFSIMEELQEKYSWTVVGDWIYRDLQLLYKTGMDIEEYANRLGGLGEDWVRRNLGDTTFHIDLKAKILTTLFKASGIVPGMSGVYLRSGMDEYTILQELGHRWDNKANNTSCPSTWCGGGPADWLVRKAGGDPQLIRWMNGVSDIPLNYQWDVTVHNGYGNTASAEYFAESFAYLIIDQSKLPSPNIGTWMDYLILPITGWWV